MNSALIVIDLINEIIGENGHSNASAEQTRQRDVVAKPTLLPPVREPRVFRWFG